LLSGDETEQQLESTYDKARQTTKFAACIGKTYGFTCKNCPYRSYCDGIPEDF
jgi:CRISPR/Cas system-associated exonuclease Cas4 (RecB family)